jgi:hypothetical protein
MRERGGKRSKQKKARRRGVPSGGSHPLSLSLLFLLISFTFLSFVVFVGGGGRRLFVSSSCC